MLSLLSIIAFWGLAVADSQLSHRAFPAAPDGYTPTAGDCPADRPSIRSAGTGLSESESSWLKLRRNFTLQTVPNFLESLNISGFDAKQYAQAHFGNVSNAPNIGLAFSGGGLRAALTGAGAIQAFDAREGGNDPTNLEGLLDSATYVAGLSGGGWLVGSLFINNFSTISSLLNPGPGASTDLWNFTNPVISGPDTSAGGEADFFTTLHKEVEGKADAGYNISFGDYWGRALAYQFINAPDGGPSYTFSSIRNDSNFLQGKIPFPLLATDSQVAGSLSFSPTNTTVYEFNPFELGTWDPTNYGFVDLQFLGSNFSNGTIPNNEQCVRGFDNAGFALGTTSSILNSLVTTALLSELPSSVLAVLGNLVNETRAQDGLVSLYEPNPFKGWNPTGHALDANSDALVLVDGGTDLENLPLQPLIQPARAVDVIVAVDSSADTSYIWPNGSALVATYERSLNASGIANHTAFPSIPDPNTFINLGLNQRPTFFGCNASNSSGPTPLIVYIPNAPYTYSSNISTFQLDINMTQRDAMVANGYQVAKMGNGTANKEFKSCLGCAILSRSFGRTGTAVPAACSSCFQTFCWDGTLNATTPAPYTPVVGSAGKLPGNSSSSGNGSGSGGSGGSSGSGSSQSLATGVVPTSFSLALSLIMGFLLM